jgi:general secretion pathway protein G
MRSTSRHAGFTLLELATAVLIGGLLLSIAIPTYRAHIERLKVGQARQDLMFIATAIERFRTVNNFRLPDSLAELSSAPPRDPWDRPYEYLNFSAPIPGIKGKIRKDHNLHPLNTEFDLYSMGADGRSVPPLTGKPSHDDVIWARDGSFIGLGKEF